MGGGGGQGGGVKGGGGEELTMETCTQEAGNHR